MKKHFYLALAFVAALLTTACNTSNDDRDYITTQSIPACFSYVVNTSDGQKQLNAGLGYNIQLNYTKASAKVTISGVKLPNGVSYPTMTFDGLRFEANDKGWYILSAPVIKPEIGTFGTVPTVTNFSVKLLERAFDNSYEPAILVRFTIDEHFSFMSSRQMQSLAGTTTSVMQNGPEFQTKTTTYTFAIDPEKQKLSIGVGAARFIKGMPAINFVLKDITFSADDKAVRFVAEKIIPNIGNTPNDGFPISNLSGVLDFEEGLNMHFDCNPKTVEGATFNVGARCTFLDLPEEADA